MPQTAQIAHIKAAVNIRFAAAIAAGRLVTRGGVYNCRVMRPQPGGYPYDVWSEHSWGNAWDLYVRGHRATIESVISWLRKEGAAGRLPVGTILYPGTKSPAPIEGAPKRNPRPYHNLPPCAPNTTYLEEGPFTMDTIKDIQGALRTSGFTDYDDEDLELDGEWGPRTASASAFATMVDAAFNARRRGITSGDGIVITGTIT